MQSFLAQFVFELLPPHLHLGVHITHPHLLVELLLRHLGLHHLGPFPPTHLEVLDLSLQQFPKECPFHHQNFQNQHHVQHQSPPPLHPKNAGIVWMATSSQSTFFELSLCYLQVEHLKHLVNEKRFHRNHFLLEVLSSPLACSETLQQESIDTSRVFLGLLIPSLE